ncbi:cupin domain-containing protein [Pseudooceanicola sp. LIPI14-2-Ac024]|uniref:cupin domain-containing protein n=1 Tax=Pseudooceanicola sp. LIPI14-2-Ac024 TaxID=3344875 RepID=UPI0035D08D91
MTKDKLSWQDWSRRPELWPDEWRGAAEGAALGTNVTVLFYETDEVGIGPKWHVHPYDEVFVIRQGRALFTVGDRKLEAETGDVVLGPANVPHKFHNLGPGKLVTVDIHQSDRWIQTDLDDPELG